jgi:hypothetical protein
MTNGQAQKGQGSPRWAIVRDMLLFLGGLFGVLHQEFVASDPKPALLVFYGAMMGLPAYLNFPLRRSNGNSTANS